ncbi:hypothetical protein MSG28_011416 [Choristoneura fumiferana]|uniref:Uncharacterized protein n=1 Tax=Choristoneura fumiferana TaxID=7141 RepID=A0ACC0JNB3_CHOFU|nr:hypothetical protein MSG28_011416 [Choristoneura fumiferana]
MRAIAYEFAARGANYPVSIPEILKTPPPALSSLSPRDGKIRSSNRLKFLENVAHCVSAASATSLSAARCDWSNATSVTYACAWAHRRIWTLASYSLGFRNYGTQLTLANTQVIIIISAVGLPVLDVGLYSTIEFQLLRLEAACNHREPATLTRSSVHLIGGRRKKGWVSCRIRKSNSWPKTVRSGDYSTDKSIALKFKKKEEGRRINWAKFSAAEYTFIPENCGFQEDSDKEFFRRSCGQQLLKPVI